MPPLTEEFIECLKEDLKHNPIEIEMAHSTAAHGDNNSQLNHWRNWQHNFDKSCMEWGEPTDFIARLEMAVRNGDKYPDHPVYVKGTPSQQMGILLTIWYTDPELLLRYYDLLRSYIQKSKKEKRVGQHLNMVCDNRNAIIAILQFADNHHLGSGAVEILKTIIEEVREEFPGRKYDQMIAYWWTYMPEAIVDTLRIRVSEFIKVCAFDAEENEPTERYVSDGETDLFAFFAEMWNQDPVTTIEHAEALRRSMVGKVLRNLPLSSDERERLCLCGQILDEVLHSIESSKTSSAEKIMLDDYRGLTPRSGVNAGNKSSDETNGHNASLNLNFEFSPPSMENHLDPGYRTISYKGTPMELSLEQAAVINILHQPWLAGFERMQKRLNKSAIVSRAYQNWEIEIDHYEFAKVFRGKTGKLLKGTGLLSDDRKGNYGLDLYAFKSTEI